MIELHLQIANDYFKIETGMIGRVTRLNGDDQPVDSPSNAPERHIKLKTFVFSGLGVPMKQGVFIHTAGPISRRITAVSTVYPS